MSASQRERQLHYLINDHAIAQVNLERATKSTADTAAQYDANLQEFTRRANDAHDALRSYVAGLKL